MSKRSLLVVLVVYSFGFFLAALLILLCLLKLMVIRHRERLPYFARGVIVVANHPSMIDPFLMVSLFFKRYLQKPFDAPLSVPKESVYRLWCLSCLRPFMIPVERDDSSSAASSFRQIKQALNNGRMVIIFPESGRTYKGDEFLLSNKGKKIRVLKNGIGLLVRLTKAPILPIWIENSGFGDKITFKIGDLLDFNDKDFTKEQITQSISDALLKLADE